MAATVWAMVMGWVMVIRAAATDTVIQVMAMVATTVASPAAYYKMSVWVGSQGQPIFYKEIAMFTGSYLYPFYRSPFIGGYGYPYPSWQYAGYGNIGGYYGGNNIIGSAIANQNQNVHY